MACSVSGALSLGTGDPGTLASDLGVYDFRTHTTFFLLAGQDINRQVGGQMLCFFFFFYWSSGEFFSPLFFPHFL